MLHYRCFHKSFVNFRIYSQLTLVISVAASRNLRLYRWTSTFSCSLWFLRLLIRFLISRLIGPKKTQDITLKTISFNSFPIPSSQWDAHRAELHNGANNCNNITFTAMLTCQYQFTMTSFQMCLQCFDTVNWASGRASGLYKLVWLSVLSEVKLFAYRPADATASKTLSSLASF